jgi:hypothetical protein
MQRLACSRTNLQMPYVFHIIHPVLTEEGCFFFFCADRQMTGDELTLLGSQPACTDNFLSQNQSQFIAPGHPIPGQLAKLAPVSACNMGLLLLVSHRMQCLQDCVLIVSIQRDDHARVPARLQHGSFWVWSA